MPAPSPLKSTALSNWLMSVFRGWRKMSLSLDQCDPHEVERMAHELGLTPRELSSMSKLEGDAADLLLQRMAAMGLDAAAVSKSEPSSMWDMQRLCSLCMSKNRCHGDLQGDHNSGWVNYCPNASTLFALQYGAAQGQ